MNTRVVRPTEPALVPALFSSRERAEAAIAKLRDFGIADTDIGVAVPAAGRYQRREPSDRETLTAAGVGAAIGGRFGSLAGMGLFGLIAARTSCWSHEPEIARLLQQNGARAVLDELTLDKHWSDLELEHPSGQSAP